MNSADKYKKPLEMDSFGATHSRWKDSYICNAFHGYEQTSFGYIIKGNVDLYTRNGCMHLSAGTLFLVPEKMRYRSEWHGSPDIEYISLHSHSSRFSVPGEEYRMQAIPAFSDPKTEMLFRQIYTLCESDTRSSRIRALGLYCIFFADVLPYLEKTERGRMHPALSDALSYIRENFRRDFSMDELAAYCRISTSRLHHLFAEKFQTTPARYRNELRIEWAARELTITGASIEQIAEEAGFSSSIYFREVFKSVTGTTPTAYRSDAARSDSRL